MKKLFKEILKSLSKTKALIIGLIVLTFLSSSAFTLLNDVKKNYTTQFQEYKDVSKLHDLTIQTDIAAIGEKPSQIYIPSHLQGEKTEYIAEDNLPMTNKKAIRIPLNELEVDIVTKETYVKASKLLGNVITIENDFYIKTKDLYRFFQVNNIINFIDNNNFIDPTIFPPTPLKKYIKPGEVIPINYILKPTDNITRFKNNNGINVTLGDLITIIPGEDKFLSSTDDRITNVRNIYINAKTKEASISQTLRNSWEKQGVLITINSYDVAKLLGFKEDIPGIYLIDLTLNQKGIFDINLPVGRESLRLSSSLEKTMINIGFSLNLNKTIEIEINKNNINEYYVLDKPLKLDKTWIVTEKTTFKYSRYHTILNFNFLNDQADQNKLWTLNYKDYISNLTSQEEKYFSQTIYWNKTQIIEIVGQNGETVLDPNETIHLSQKITALDLNRTLILKEKTKINDPITSRERVLNNNSILKIELNSGFISQTTVDVILANINGDTSIKLQEIINNTNSKNEKIKQIDDGAKTIGQQNLYLEILKLVESVQNIGIRENLTVTGFDNDVTNIYHFINGGDKDQTIRFNNETYIEQNVGKLYNETNEKSLLFSLSSQDNIKNKVVPQAYILKILNVIFSGMSVDNNYINPIITFENYRYLSYGSSKKTNSNISSKINGAKIIRMHDSFGNFFGITKQAPKLNEDEGKYYILKEEFQNNKKIWVSRPPLNFNGSSEDMQNFINAKELNFADITADKKNWTIVGKDGWAKQNPNYSNKYSIPFKIMVPNANIINNWQESNNFNVFRDNLINSLTNIVSPLIGASNFKILMESITTSLTKNGFSDVLTFPSQIENKKLHKILFGAFYEGAQESERLYWNDLLDEILFKIISNINNDPEYVSDQIKVINIIIKIIFGNSFDLSLILNEKNTKNILIGLRKIFTSINIDEVIIQIWNNFYDIERPDYQAIGVGDILPIIVNNIADTDILNPTKGFKAGLKDIILEIEFNKIINNIKNNLDEESLELFGPIIDQLNGNLGTPNPNSSNDYFNINLGLNKIIDSIDLSYFGKSIQKHSKIREYFIDNGEELPKKYTVNSISISGIFSALLSSMGNNNDGDKLLNEAIIQLLNLSSKTTNILGIYQPESDPNKLDIRDLQSLLKSSTPKLNTLEASLKELSKLLKNPEYVLNPNSTMGKYLIDYIFNFTDDISIQNKDIKKRIDIYLEFMSETKFINFDPNMLIDPNHPNPTLGGNITNTGNSNSLADKFINMINPNVRKSSNNLILDLIMNQVYNEFYNSKNLLQSRDMTVEILNFYSFWMKFSEINLNSSKTTSSSDVANQIKRLVNNVLNKNSDIGRILNNSSQSFDFGPLASFNILDGFSNAKGITNKLAQANPQKWLSPAALDYYFDYKAGLFTPNTNTISLVTGLTSIIDIINPLDNSRSTLITDDFINLFLPNDKEKANIMLTLGQKTLNTLSGPTNSIMENLGLSSVIMSPFTGVLNAPVLLWFTVNQNATSVSSSGNLDFILKNKLYKFNSTEYQEGIDYSGFKYIIDSVVGDEIFIDNPIDMDKKITFSMDLDYLNYMTDVIFVDSVTGDNIEFLGIDISNTISSAVSSFAEARVDDFQIVIADIGSYVVKINDAYLKSNNKSIYDLAKNIPTSSIEMQELLNTVDKKYTININGLKFLIIGTDSTVDYLYPVTNLNNIQVDTKTQALVYVNQFGFDRAKESNANAVINQYFLVKAPKGMKPIFLRDKINKYIYKTISGLGNYNDLTEKEKENSLYKKSFLYNETNPLNPEISLRVQTIENLILIINDTNILISLILIILTGVITIFVIKRYVSSRSKVLGILKAQGYRSIQIASSICLFALIVSVFGATLGYVVGHLLQIPVMNIFSIYWTLPIGPTSFSFNSLLITVLVPLLGLILLTILTTLFLLRIKPINLMDGSFELNNSKSAEIIKRKLHSKNIKSKFTLSLSLNSIGKLFSLLLSLLLTVSIISFSFASRNAFGNAIHKTYKNRNYDFKIDLLTPTLEGGSLTTFDKENVENLLYVPIGNANEGITYLGDYFKPGTNSVINPILSTGNIYPNGNPTKFDKHIITKSSFDLTVNVGGVQVNVWNTLFNSMPDSQKSSATEISQYAGKYLEWTQGLSIDSNGNEYKPISDTDHNKAPYFKYIINDINPKKSKFVYRNINTNDDYFYEEITIEAEKPGDLPNQKNIRNKYRDFLVQGYNKALTSKVENNLNKNIDTSISNFAPIIEPKLIQDYFITFGSIVFNKEKNEKYSYATASSIEKTHNINPIINGYNKNSEQVQILDVNRNNLLELTSNKWSSSKNTVPIIINHVVKDKYNLKIGSKLKLEVTNTTDRFINNIKDKLLSKLNSEKVIFNNLSQFEKSNTKWEFEIVGINETFINEEWTTSQEIINDITFLNNPLLLSQMPEKNTPFNGILSIEKSPVQATDSLGLYSENGYWAADDKINLSTNNISSEQQEKNKNIFKELFYKQKNINGVEKNSSIFSDTLRIINPEFSCVEIETLIKGFLDIKNISLSEIVTSPGSETIINSSIEKFSQVYNSNNILTPLFSDIKSKNIESGFISNTTSSINSISTIIIVLSLLITITILIMISTLIINENERNVAIFSILGYNNREKIILFFSLYIPIIILSILLSIPLTLGIISWFIALTNSSILISLSFSLTPINVLLSSLIVFGIFSITSIIAWLNLNRIKPIILLKGD